MLGRRASLSLLTVTIIIPAQLLDAQTKASGGAIIVGGNVIGSKLSTGPSPRQMRAAMAEATRPLERQSKEQEKTIRSLERQLGTNQEMLRSIALAFGKKDVPDEKIQETLFELAAEYRATKQQIATVPASAEVKDAAIKALGAGQFDVARDLAMAANLTKTIADGARYNIEPLAIPEDQHMRWHEIRFLDDWPSRNLVSIEIPQLTKIRSPVSPIVKVHKGVATNIKAAFAELESRGLLSMIGHWCGSFRQRVQRKTLTAHAFGLAFDLNCTSEDERRVQDDPHWPEVIKIFQDHGFAWGGGWRNFADPMHFQASRLGSGSFSVTAAAPVSS